MERSDRNSSVQMSCVWWGKVRNFLARRFELLKFIGCFISLLTTPTAEEANKTNVILVWNVLWRGAISRCNGITAQVSKKLWLISTVSQLSSFNLILFKLYESAFS